MVRKHFTEIICKTSAAIQEKACLSMYIAHQQVVGTCRGLVKDESKLMHWDHVEEAPKHQCSEFEPDLEGRRDKENDTISTVS